MQKTILFFSAILFLFSTITSCKKDCDNPGHGQPQTKTLTLQPGAKDGDDCLVGYREGDEGQIERENQNFNPDLSITTWTYNALGWGTGIDRSYLKFIGLSQLPANAVIVSAKLSLYGLTKGDAIAAPEGNSYYPGSPYESIGNNKAWIKKVTGNWDEATITWNNKPGTTDENQVEIPASTTHWNYNVTNLDVTKLIKEMVSKNQNYGFCMQLQDESIYKSLAFSGSEATNIAQRPKLVVEYTE